MHSRTALKVIGKGDKGIRMEIDTIFNQECLVGLKGLPENSIDLTITSPPYDSLRDYHISAIWNFEMFRNIAVELYRVTKVGGTLVWIVNDMTKQGSETGTSFRQALFFKDIGFLLHDTMIWQKMTPFQHKNRYIQSFDYMFVLSKDVSPTTANLICDRKNKCAGVQVHGSDRQFDGSMKPRSEKQKAKRIKDFGARLNIWDIPCEKANKTGHPAVFPKRLVVDHILTWSNPGDIVCDPFLGSGTTAIAATETERHYIGWEINPDYFQICLERLEKAQSV